MSRAFSFRPSLVSLVLIAVLAAVISIASPAAAKNQGCCVLNDGTCTTATRSVCRALHGTLQGLGTQSCDADKGCVTTTIGCASCFGGEKHGELCEMPTDCGAKGFCQTAISLAPAAGDGPGGGVDALPKLDLRFQDLMLRLPEQRQYAVKFVCGIPGPRGFAFNRGSYTTAINVHNPSLLRASSFRYKIASALPALQPGTITDFQVVQIAADGALEIDCPLILDRLGEAIFATGFVVIMSNVDLDVVAVHVAGERPNEGGSVRSIDVETVEPRIMNVF